MYSTVLVPTDGSDAASDAVGVALALADRFDAEVHALFVVGERFVATQFDLVVEDAHAAAERALDSAGERGEDAGVAVEKHLRTGLPHEEILDAIGDYDADLVAMGKHGRSGLDRFLNVGSVTERVVRHAGVQVTTVPASEDGAE